ncbi:hypothetical protein BgiMline_014706, partial [Biomphalaria glabrata]
MEVVSYCYKTCFSYLSSDCDVFSWGIDCQYTCPDECQNGCSSEDGSCIYSPYMEKKIEIDTVQVTT